MKTWLNARAAHRSRLNWCSAFSEVLLSLNAAEAPPPDDVGAAHADWATKHGILRVNMTLKNAVALSGAKNVLNAVDALKVPRQIAKPEQLADVATLWAHAIRELALPTFTERDVTSDLAADFTPHAGGPDAGTKLATQRNDPYWDPAKGKQPSYDQLLIDNRQLRALVDELRTELDVLKNRINFAAEGT